MPCPSRTGSTTCSSAGSSPPPASSRRPAIPGSPSIPTCSPRTRKNFCGCSRCRLRPPPPDFLGCPCSSLEQHEQFPPPAQRLLLGGDMTIKQILLLLLEEGQNELAASIMEAVSEEVIDLIGEEILG